MHCPVLHYHAYGIKKGRVCDPPLRYLIDQLGFLVPQLEQNLPVGCTGATGAVGFSSPCRGPDLDNIADQQDGHHAHFIGQTEQGKTDDEGDGGNVLCGYISLSFF